MGSKKNYIKFSGNRIIAIFVSLLLPMIVYAKSEFALPVYNSSFEDWNDSYPLSLQGYTTTVPTGWYLGNTGYAPCDAVVKSHSRHSARTGEYAAFFDSRSYPNSIISDEYNLAEGSYNFNVYAASLGYAGTAINLQVEGAVKKNVKFNVTGSSGVYTKYSLSFDMETSGVVKFKIDNSKEWDGNSSINHFVIDDWSLTTIDGELIDIESPNVYKDGNFSYYLYNNGEAELAIVNNINITGEIEIPETISINGKSYIVRSIAPYAFKNCTNISKVVLPKRMYTIGEAAFESCINLQSIVLPTYLNIIGQNAFAGCLNLDQVIVLAKSNLTLSTNVFPENATLYVPTPKTYQSLHTKVLGLGFLNTELFYTGNIPSFNIVCPEGISYRSLDRSDLSSDAGTYTLNAIFSGYGMSVDGEFDVTINKIPLSIKAPSLSREYGDDNPIIKLIYTGFVNNESESDLSRKPQVTVNASPKSSIGNYEIVLSNAASPNYEISYENGILYVTSAYLAIAVDNSTREYGVDNPHFTLRYNGLKNQETEPEWTTAPSFNTTASIKSNVGSYDISVVCVPKNYTIIENIPGVLTISKAHLILKANDKSKVYFEHNPIFDYTLIGLRNQDDLSCITQQPIFNCDADQSSDCGAYPILPLNASAVNYEIDYRSGLLTVKKRQLTASVGDYSRAYGEDNPDFEISYFGFVNNEDENVLVKSTKISCTATTDSDAGLYPIEIYGGDAKNYHISKYNYGTLTITKANQIITWNQDLYNIDLYSQVELQAISNADLPITYEIAPNNVAGLYSNLGKLYLDCFGSGTVKIRATQNGNKNYNAAPVIEKTLVVNGNGGDPSVPQIYLNVKTAGSLPSMIAENRKFEIKNLRLSGNLNGTDIRYIREMAGSDVYGEPTSGNLQILDISECNIVSGGDGYFYTAYGTSSNVIGGHMFYNCKTLVTLHLPKNITSLEDYSIAGCDALSVVSLPSSLEYIRSYAFQNDINLLMVHLPDKIRSIGDMAFCGCIQLTEFTIPQNVKYIGEGILNRCQNITQVEVYDNPNFASIDGVLFSKSLDKLLIYPANSPSDEFSVPNGVTTISSYALVEAKHLKSLNLPETLRSIGSETFMGCVNLSSITISALTPPSCSNDCFEKVNKTHCQLRVPKGCYSYYWVAPVWAEFNNIIEFDDSGIEEVSDEKILITSKSNTISIKGLPVDTHIFIYGPDGMLVCDTKTCSDYFNYTVNSSGIYIIAIEGKIYKVMVR